MEMGNASRRLQSVLEDYVNRSQIAQAHRRTEYAAVIKLQCAWRRKMAYLLLRRWNRASTFIQRVYRGHLGRERHMHFTRRRDKVLRMAYFNSKATQIQRIYRGYYSRKYIHSYYARKAFLADAMKIAAELREELTSYYKRQCINRHWDTAINTQLEIDKFMDSNHALLSTKDVKGLYYCPYLAVLGKPNQVEEEIRETKKRRDSIEDMKAVRRVKKVKDPEVWKSNFITTIGPYCPYFTQYEARMEKEKKSSLLQIAGNFRTTFTDHTNLFKGRTIKCETEYSTPYEMKLANRRRKKAMRMSVAAEPFFVAVPGGRRFSHTAPAKSK